MHQPRVAVIDVPGLPYDGTTLEKRGLGGSESCVIYLTRELVKLGVDATVFCRCAEDDNSPGVYEGVTFRPLAEAHNSDEVFDVVIVSRTVQPFMEEVYQGIMRGAGWKMLWMHDTFLWGDAEMERLVVNGDIDEIMTLSDWHTAYILNCNHGHKRNYEMLKNRNYVIRNCMGNYLDEVDISAKDPDQFVYNASVSKGMVVLLEHVWPRIRERIPTAKLKIIGGFYRFPERHGPDEQEQKWMQLRDDNQGRNGVEFTGVIPQRQIAQILAKASWFLYPTEFPETFGISTLEAQAYNCVPLTARFGALEEVALDSTSYKLDYSVTPNVIFPNINQEEQVARFVDMVEQAYRVPYIRQQKAYAGNGLRDIIGWDTMAVQFKQHIYRKLGWYLPVNEQRKALWVSNRVKQLTGRRTSNAEDCVEPKLSQEWPVVVVSPFRNSARWLQDHIWSVAAQNYDNYQHILVDDASDDNSQEVIARTLEEIGPERASRVRVIRNSTRQGAVCNQIQNIRALVDDPESIVMLLDGDDFLVNHPDVFDRINGLHQNGKEFTYGSCWSMVDDIPLVAQPYPRRVRQAKSYREHRFNWGIPYTHLRTFRKRLLDAIPDSVFQHESGEWFGAGGDVATFYNILEQVDNPDAIHAVTDILVNYNDTHPDNDYKVNGEEQNRTAAAIRKQKRLTTSADLFTVIVPTMWRCLDITERMLGQLLDHPWVHQVIVFDNDPTNRPQWDTLFDHPRMLLTSLGSEPGNYYVNPCWNQGVRLSQTPRVCIWSDDVEFDLELFGRIQPELVPGGGVYGLITGEESKGHTPYTDGTISFRKWKLSDDPKPGNWGDDIHGFGQLMFVRKEDWVPIIDDLKIYFGDDFIKWSHLTRGMDIYLIENIQWKSPMAATTSDASVTGGHFQRESPLFTEWQYRQPMPWAETATDQEIEPEVQSVETQPQRMRILLAMPTSRYIESSVFEAIHALKVPPGAEMEFQFFYGYSRVQILNLIADWTRRYDFTVFLRPDVIPDENAVVHGLGCDGDVVTLDDSGIFMVRHSVFAEHVPYPQFVANNSLNDEIHDFVDRAVKAGARLENLEGLTQSIITIVTSQQGASA